LAHARRVFDRLTAIRDPGAVPCFGFLGIAHTVGQVLERLPCAACDDLEAVVAYDADARRLATEVVASTSHGMPA
jgi:hypothetical protein